VHILPLRKYRLTLDQRHLDGSINVVPIEKLGIQNYELPFVGVYGLAIVIESSLRLPQFELNRMQILTGKQPIKIPHDGLNGYALAHDSSLYFFFGKITVLLSCNLSDPISAKVLNQTDSDRVRHAWLIGRAKYTLRQIKIGNRTTRTLKFGRFIMSRLIDEYQLMDHTTKRMIIPLVYEDWQWQCELFNTYDDGPHVRIVECLENDGFPFPLKND